MRSRAAIVREVGGDCSVEEFELDPPRAGAETQAAALAKSVVPVVVAVSCNPVTLVRDLAILVAGGYRVEKVVPIDQFHYAPHLETVAVLRRPSSRKHRG